MSARRGFLKQVVGATGALPFAPGLANPATAPTPIAPAAGYLCFGPEEAAFVETLVDVMCPADELTPSGVDCGLAVYIDRQLAGAFGRGAKRYAQGPWQPGRPQQGSQSPMTPEANFKAGLVAANDACAARFDRPFDQLSAADADAFLTDLADGRIGDARLALAAWFNELVYPLFTQACFADPIYGGNRDKLFWKMLGYPGLPATHAVDMIRYRGRPFPGAQDPKSITDFS